MEIIISGKTFSIDNPISSGGEGEIYPIDNYSLAKIYHKQVVNRERRLKVLALCNSYQNNISHLGDDSFAFPQQPAYENKELLDFLCGFSMRYFKNCSTLGDIGYNLQSANYKSNKLDDNKAVEFIYNTFDVVDRLHKSRIILGDVNPSNILYNDKLNYPIIIDLDAAQIGQFRCLSWSDEYLDPLTQFQGKNIQGGFNYTYESDIFSIACVCFEFIIGINPFFCRTDPSNDVMFNKENGISVLRYIHNGTNNINGIKYLNNTVNDNIKKRINHLRTSFPKLYNFFISIFLDSKRTSLMQTLDRTDPRHPAYIFYSQSGFDQVLKQIITARKPSPKPQTQQIQQKVVGSFTIPDSGFSKIISSVSQVGSATQTIKVSQSKFADPDQLNLFLKNYGIDLTSLLGVN